MDVSFRSAQPDDAPVAVDLIHASGPAAFDYVFAREGADARAFLATAFADGAGEFGFRNHVVGEHAGAVVAVGAGFGPAEARGFALAAARQIISHFGWRAAGAIVRGLRVERVIRPPGRGECYVAHLGVAPDLRGQGIGAQLLGWLLARARERGYRSATLDVALTNPRAEALYARLGFSVETERRSALANRRGAVPAHHRMRLDLG